MGAPSMRSLTDQLCNATRGIRDGKRPGRGTQSMFGQIGNQTMIGILQSLDLRTPHPATDPSSVQEADRGRADWPAFANAQARKGDW